MDEQLQELMQNMSPEQQAMMMQNFSGKSEQINDQLAQADLLRDRKTGEGVQAGNQFVASSPLSGIANMVNQGSAAYQRSGAEDRRQTMVDEKEESIKAVLDALRNKGSQQPQLEVGGLQDAPIQPYNPNQQIA